MTVFETDPSVPSEVQLLGTLDHSDYAGSAESRRAIRNSCSRQVVTQTNANVVGHDLGAHPERNRKVPETGVDQLVVERPLDLLFGSDHLRMGSPQDLNNLGTRTQVCADPVGVSMAELEQAALPDEVEIVRLLGLGPVGSRVRFRWAGPTLGPGEGDLLDRLARSVGRPCAVAAGGVTDTPRHPPDIGRKDRPPWSVVLFLEVG